jgi:hypothetical protein
MTTDQNCSTSYLINDDRLFAKTATGVEHTISLHIFVMSDANLFYINILIIMLLWQTMVIILTEDTSKEICHIIHTKLRAPTYQNVI